MAAPKKTTAKAAKVEKTIAATPAPVAAARSEAKGSGTTKARPAAPITLTHDAIAKRAFEIYASRGYAPGNPAEDWSEAERQLRAGL
jgi:hypothetical protein